MDMSTVGSPWLWAGFIAFVVVMLALDLGVFHRKDHAVRSREALTWSLVWIGLALVFGAGVWWRFGSGLGMEFLTGYLVEKSLSVDNLFVFVVLFRTLAIPPAYQHRVLFWGVLSALVLRAAMIVGGTALLARFEWFMYVFGGFLLITGVKLLLTRNEEPHPERNAAFRWFKRVLPTTPRFHGHAFFAREDGKLMVTPLFIALAFIEVSDVIFAVFAVTRDPFIVFTSNIFAILGLRSLYFLLANMVERFTYLKPALSAVLIYVGVKMLVADVVHVPPVISLVVIAAILGVAVVASVVKVRRELEAEGPPVTGGVRGREARSET